MLKKTMAALLALLLLLGGCAREQSPPAASSSQPADSAPQSAAPDDGLYHGGDVTEYLQTHLPEMDGSTSLIPLEAGLRAALYGVSQEQAALDVVHTSTWDSFYHLLDGDADLIFSCPLSETQRQLAGERDVALAEVPVAMEGFVFVVNAKNPVDTLTQAQLRGIYSGAVTNWKELGGSDAPIVAYQRNADSGSQNYMIDFMGDTPLMPAPTEMRPGSMAGLMDVIAVNDNAENAIGYSVYAYAADMYGGGDDIKFIAVDGVAPDKNTMAARSYPLLGYNYAVFRADAPENGGVRLLADWLTGYDGQLAVAKAGYVTLTDIGFDYTAGALKKYQATGRGGPAPEKPDSYEYTITLPLATATLADGTPTCRLDSLADKALQAEINGWIDEQMSAAAADSRFADYIERLNAGEEYERFAIAVNDVYWRITPAPPAFVAATARNGYLSVAVSQKYIHQVQDGYDRNYAAETATWDLLSGKRLAPEELFYDGVDIAAALNAYIDEQYRRPIDAWHTYYEMKSDFAGLTLSGWRLTHDAIYIDQSNPYFGYGVRIALDGLPAGLLAADRAREMSACFDSDDFRVIRTFCTTQRHNVYRYVNGEFFSCAFLSEDTCPAAAKINAAVESYLNGHYTEQAIRRYYGDEPAEALDLYFMDWRLTEYGGKYAVFSGYQPRIWNNDGTVRALYPYPATLIFDMQTGEELGWQDLLADGWQAHASLRDYNSVPVPDADYDAFSLNYFTSYYLGSDRFDGITFLLLDRAGNDYTLSAPAAYINW